MSLSASNIDKIVWSGSGTGFHPYGVDNIQFDNTTSAVPEPSSLTLLGIGVAGIAGYGWRRRGIHCTSTFDAEFFVRVDDDEALSDDDFLAALKSL